MEDDGPENNAKSNSWLHNATLAVMNGSGNLSTKRELHTLGLTYTLTGHTLPAHTGGQAEHKAELTMNAKAYMQEKSKCTCYCTALLGATGYSSSKFASSAKIPQHHMVHHDMQMK